jgi:hypothetical protein
MSADAHGTSGDHDRTGIVYPQLLEGELM